LTATHGDAFVFRTSPVGPIAVTSSNASIAAAAAVWQQHLRRAKYGTEPRRAAAVDCDRIAVS